MSKKPKSLDTEDLRKKCDPQIYDFETTDDIEEGTVLINQKKALKSIDFGLNIESKGYNLYLSGTAGTGRNTTILKKVNELAEKEESPADICYLYNFKSPDKPKVLKLPAGMGCELKKDMEEFIDGIQGEAKKSFSSDEYEKNKKEVVEDIKHKKDNLSSKIDRKAQKNGFAIRKSITGIAVIPLNEDDNPMKEEEYQELSQEEKEDLEEKRKEIYDAINSTTRKIKELQRKSREEIKKLDKKIVMYAIEHRVEELKEKYKDYERVINHIDSIVEDILDNVNYFKNDDDNHNKVTLPGLGQSEEDVLKKYEVNVLVDNCETSGAPVINEEHPIYHNIVGKVEHQQKLGVLKTDFTMIKPGSVHKANGGYLVIQAMDILRNPYAWDALKRIIKYGDVEIESLQQKYGLVQTATLKPEPVKVDLKVVLVGKPFIYHLLYKYDEDFKKLFKVKVDFDSTMKRTKKSLKNYGNFVAQQCKEGDLLPFNREAVARIVDYSARQSVHKKKLSAKFLDIADIVKEGDYWAKKDNADLVEKSHIQKAIQEKIYRSNMIEEKIQELIDENTLMVDVKGEKIGQINGLAVLDLGDYMFGKPSRITARTYMGDGKIKNIEREADMSGKIHSKGVMTLTGFMGEKFGRDKPLAFSASITFEQLYEEVDGDSASSTELYCLLSSLSGIPLKQDLAVTGSVNQRGEIQPIGGVNQKIEGYFEVCKLKGLTGNQGVLIPAENTKHLMLKEEVIEAVRDEKFHIYPVKTVDEGLKVLTGTEASKIYDKVDSQLEEYANLAAEYAKKGKDKKD
ncbi:MAG: Lon protease family protein [Elusimicrobiota bacterium]